MTKILVVEDQNMWQELHKYNLKKLVGEDRFEIVDNFKEAKSKVKENDYKIYILDGQFPEEPRGMVSEFGIDLSQEIYKKEGSYDKIIIASGNPRTLQQSLELGITKVYNKGGVSKYDQDGDIKDFINLKRDLKQILNL